MSNNRAVWATLDRPPRHSTGRSPDARPGDPPTPRHSTDRSPDARPGDPDTRPAAPRRSTGRSPTLDVTAGLDSADMETGGTVPSRAPAERVGDAERNHVVSLLSEHCTAGRLTLDEFSERVGAALAARTHGELEATLTDLPRIPPAPGTTTMAPGTTTMPGTTAMAPGTATTIRRRIGRLVLAVMSDTSERGRYVLGPDTTTVAVMGSCRLDLRQAVITEPEIVITAVAVMGSVDIIVPEGIEADLTGLAVMGEKELHLRDMPPIPGSPRILVRAFPVMGSVNVQSRPVTAPTQRHDRHRRTSELDR